MLESLLESLRRLRDRFRRGQGQPPRKRILAENEKRLQRLRRRGVEIGENCFILTEEFSLEPYLVRIGNGVAIAGGTMFITHDGVAWALRRTRPEAQHFGLITIGDNTVIGQNCIILPGARIGANCVIGAGSVVRGTIKDGMMAIGNPARIVGRTSLCLALMNRSPDTLDTYRMTADDREAALRAHFFPGRPEKPDGC